MKTGELKITVLTPAAGCWLTPVEEPADGYDREFCEIVYLGAHDSADNWREVTDAERAELIKAAEQKRAESPEQNPKNTNTANE